MRPTARTALLYTSFGHALCHGSKLVLPVVLLSAARDFGVTDGRLALALTCYGVAIGACSVPAGLLADRFGPARVLILYFAALAGAAAACASAQGFAHFVLAHTLLGAAAGLYHPPGLSLLSLATTREERGDVMGWHGVLGQLGIACAPLVVLAVQPAHGWRAAYLVLAATAAAGVLLGLWLRARGALLRGVPVRHEVASDGALDRTALLLLLGAMSVNGFLLDGFTTLFPTTVHERGVQPLPGAPLDDKVVDALILGLSALAQWVGGRAAREHAARAEAGPASGARADGAARSAGRGARSGTVARRYVAVLALQPLLLLGAALALGRPQLAFALFALFAFTSFMAQPIENHILAGYTGTARRGAAYALKFSVAWILGAGAPLLVLAVAGSPFAASRGGDAWGYGALGAVALVGVLCGVLFLRRVARSGSALAAAPAAYTPPP